MINKKQHIKRIKLNDFQTSIQTLDTITADEILDKQTDYSSTLNGKSEQN